MRAEHWYRLALAQESGPQKLSLEVHINELGKKIGELAALPPGAVLVMTFEPSTSKRQGYVLDVSQHGYVGTVHGAVFAEGIAGNALAFDRKDDYVEVASTRWLSAPSAFTLAAWVNAVSWKDSGYILSKEDWQSDVPHGYALRYGNGGIVDFTIGSSGWRSAVAAKKVEIDGWHHIAATSDGKIARVFLDGEMAGNETESGEIEPSTFPFRIGQAAFQKDRGTIGRIDEVAIFNRALSPDEVRTVYRMGRAGPAADGVTGRKLSPYPH